MGLNGGGGPGPLWRRAPLRLLHSGLWGPLVAAAFVLLATAGAAGPIFADTVANAAMRSALDAVSPTARATDAAVVRLNSAAPPLTPEQARYTRKMTAIPGLSPPVALGVSVGAELAPGEDFRLTVVANGKTRLARLYGQDDVSAALVPERGTEGVGSDRPQPGAQDPGLWLPGPLARELGVSAGQPITVGVQRSGTVKKKVTRVAGIYRVGADDRRPADPPGTQLWTLREGELPLDTADRTRTAFLLVGDVATVTKLAAAVRDTIFWSLESHLDPPYPTLAEATRISAAVDQLAREVGQGNVEGPVRLGVLRSDVVSGLGDIVGNATAAARIMVARAQSLGWAGALLGLVTLAAVAVLGLGRRQVELGLLTGLGVRPITVSLLAVVENLLVAVLGMVAGTLLAWGVVAVAGPPGQVTTAPLAQAARNAALAVTAGLVVVAVLTLVAAMLAGRALSSRRELGRISRARPPWELVLVVAAVTATAGLVSRPASAGSVFGLDLLVPLLLVAAVGVAGAWVLLIGTRRLLGRARPGDRLTSPRAATRWLAVRRLTSGGSERVAIVTTLAAGFGMLVYALVGAASVRAAIADQVAVIAGASATAEIAGSWELDPAAPPLPAVGDDDLTAEGLSLSELPQTALLRSPPLPAGDSMVWRRRVSMPVESGLPELLVIDPATFAAAADWGQGKQLREARELLPALAAADRDTQATLTYGSAHATVPAIMVGYPDLSKGDFATIESLRWSINIDILASIEAFPGHEDGRDPLIVVPAGSLLPQTGVEDPRWRREAVAQSPFGAFEAWLWSSGGSKGLAAVLEPRSIEPMRVSTTAQVAQQPAFVAARSGLGYQSALGFCLAVLALLALCLFIDRAVVRSQAGDLMLARSGLGPDGPRRARVIEVVALLVAGLVLAGAGVLALAPLAGRLLDTRSGVALGVVLRPDPASVVAVLAMLAVGVLAAGAVAAVRTRPARQGEVLRDAL